MKYFLILFILLSFGVKGQDTSFLSKDGMINKAAPQAANDSVWHLEGGKLTGALGSIDTPQADRNPNDFYVDSVNIKLSPEILKAIQERGNPPYFGQPMPMPNFPYPYFEPFPKPKFLSLEEKLLMYASECWSDTLVLTKIPELPDDYIIEHPHYREVLTEAQLKKQGYEYQHRFLETEYVDGEYKAVGWKYYFVKIPTLAGFAEYLKNK